ncbi:MAG: U32 family peptidase [Faecalibacterium sp.]|nr:U32 family peptidase [Ruminococcus sp.]MCM1391790.1 U32 family peptidase [Ruminococcus sp.]MCM1485436.1 U32 family peptidase [Faecalibacterium sp.]
MSGKTEILAPAGSFECVLAAVRCGADAVYLGMPGFNARRNAENFTVEELKKAIEYCHSVDVKVHVTLNTLVSDDEIPAVKETIKHVCQLGADVLILQDIGLAALVKESAPETERHASTQMSVQTPDGIKLLEGWGFTTAVLPRELTKDEIINIRKSTDIRLETFVHGALCMSVSGQCYLSAMLGGRSGNRGLCAQPCRLPFSAPGGTGHDLSLKDLSLVDKIGELREIGVDSFKIEGRMKRPEYVAAAVTSVKASLESKSRPEINDSLKAVFSRSGFTDGYYVNKRGIDMFGTRTKQDVTAASNKVLSSLSHLYDKEQAVIAVDFLLTVAQGENVCLAATANGKSVFVSEDFIPEKAVNKPSTVEGLTERISKCGGTKFYAKNVEVDLDEGLIVPASVINSLRRKALEELEKALSSVKQKRFTDVNIKIPPHKAADEMKFHIRLSNASQIPDNFDNVENLYFPLEIEEKYVESVKNQSVRVGIEIPRGIFGNFGYVEKQLERAKQMGINIAYCNTIDAVALAKKHSMEIHTGFSMNVFNSLTVAELERLGVKSITLSPELTLSRAENIGYDVPRGIIAYGKLPLMLTRNCPMKNAVSCDKCKKRGYLTDRMGIKFPIMCNLGCSEILNSRPIYMGDRMGEIKNMDFITLYFTREKKATVDSVLDAYRKHKGVKGEFTRGLYYRGVE